MKKFIKNTLWLIMLSFLIGYIYINKDKVKEMVTTIEIYSKAITTTEFKYSEEFKINDIKFNTNNYYYNKLNDNQKNIYNSLANGIKELKQEIILKHYEYVDTQTSLSDVEIAFNYFSLDHPEVFYLNNSYIVSNLTSILGDKVVIDVSYSIETMEELNEKIGKINKGIDSYIEKLGDKKFIEAEILLHDSLAENVKYYDYKEVTDIPDECHTIEGAFLNNEAVCDGLSKAMQILLCNVDIESIVVLGKLDENPHAWNMVKLEDEWYNLDITSNKSIKQENVVIHSYFNVSDNYIADTHEFDEKEKLPISDELNNKYNYYFYMEKYIKSDDNFRVKLNEIISSNSNDKILEFYTENLNDIPNEIYNTIILNKKDEYINGGQFRYYNILHTYIIVKNKLNS